MEKKKSNLSEYSKCCGAKVVVRGKTTRYYVCLACGNACDVYCIVKERKFWTRNPKTQIIGDKREKIKDKEINKEIEQIGNA